MREHEAPYLEFHGQRMERSFVYSIARTIGYPFRYGVIGLENIQIVGPAIYICNHQGAAGPLAVILSVPVRFYPWIVAEMLDFKRAPRYLYDDFVQPVMHLNSKFGMVISKLITRISVRLLCTIGGVSIDRFGGMSIEGFRNSLNLLRECKNLLIFPEDALCQLNSETLTRPFMPGFASLCHFYQVENHKQLPVYPLAVDPGREIVSIGKPEFLRPEKDHRESINGFNQLMEDRVIKLYMELKENYYL